MTIAIYGIVNKQNWKIYVGKSINAEKRWINHLCHLRKEERHKDCNPHLYNAFKKYGEESFALIFLETFESVDERLISERELHWMEKLHSTDRKYGYNLRMDSSTGMIVHEETRRKLCAREISQARRDAISKASSKLWEDDALKEQMRHKVSDTRRSIFLQLTRDGQIINVWRSVQQALHYNHEWKWQNIYAACNGNKKSYMNYLWIRLDANEIPEELEPYIDSREYDVIQRYKRKTCLNSTQAA
jgi:group I intron endonuclease